MPLINKLSSPIVGCMRWGVWGANFDTDDYEAMIEMCLENGITSFDHADIYGDYTTEAEFGEVLKLKPYLRQQMQIITKCGIQLPSFNRQDFSIKSYNTSAAHIIASVNQSLKNFHTDYIDVLLIHRPSPLLNPHEVASAVSQLQQAGKIRQFGVSNFLPFQIDSLRTFVPIAYNQLEISIINLQPFTNGSLDNCLQHKITPLAWAPLGGGGFNDDGHPHYRSIVATATAIAKEHNACVNQVLIAFLLAHPAGIIPILGTTKTDRLLHAQSASEVKLSQEDWFRLYEASTDEEVA